MKKFSLQVDVKSYVAKWSVFVPECLTV